MSRLRQTHHTAESASPLSTVSCRALPPPLPSPVGRPTPVETSYGWRVEPKYSEEVTHVVCQTATQTNKANIRSAKFLRGVAAGKWVVSDAWLQECKLRGGHAPEEDFEIAGDRKSQVPAAPRRSRIAHAEPVSPREQKRVRGHLHHLVLERPAAASPLGGF